MLQVKIVRASKERIEGEINAFLKQIGSIPYTKVSVHDIKYTPSELQNGNETALIIFNQMRVQPSQNQPTKP